MKKRVIRTYGGSVHEAASTLGLTPQRIKNWHDKMTKLEIDGVISALVRQQYRNGKTDDLFYIPEWLLKAK